MIPVHFKAQELVPQEVYDAMGVSAWLLIDSRILAAIDTLRKLAGSPIIINNWHTGGDREYSGFRPAGCGVGARWSQHKFGRAVDCISNKYSAEELRKMVQSNIGLFEITYIEPDVSWLHMDCRTQISEWVV